MEEYRGVLKRRMKILIALMVVFLLVIVGSTGIYMKLGNEFSSSTDKMLGFQTGACTSWLIMMGIGIVKTRKAMKDDKKCRAMYIEEHDERQKMIGLKTGKTTIIIGLCVMFLAVYISGFFSETVFITLVAVLLVFSFLTLGVKIYYNKTM